MVGDAATMADENPTPLIEAGICQDLVRDNYRRDSKLIKRINYEVADKLQAFLRFYMDPTC